MVNMRLAFFSLQARHFDFLNCKTKTSVFEMRVQDFQTLRHLDIINRNKQRDQE